MNERLTKDDMRRDALLEKTASAADFATHHVKSLIGGVALIVVLSLGFLLFQASQRKAEDRAAEMLHQARYEYDSGNYAAAATRLTELKQDLGGTTSGKLGLNLAGNVNAALGNWPEALTNYEAALNAHSGDPLLSMGAKRGRASALESLERYQEAADAYKSLAANTGNEAALADLLLSAARNLAAAGNSAEAETLYGDVTRMSKNPRAAQTAALRMAELQVAQ